MTRRYVCEQVKGAACIRTEVPLLINRAVSLPFPPQAFFWSSWQVSERRDGLLQLCGSRFHCDRAR